MKALSNLINRTSIRPQLFFTVATGIIFLLVSLIFASTWVSDQQIRQMLIQQGKQATSNMANNSSLALLYDSPENAETAIQSILSFPGVNCIDIYKADFSLFYSSDKDLATEATGIKPDFSVIKNITEPRILSENKHTWKFIAPVSIKARNQSMQEQLFSDQINDQQQLIGYIIITSSKDSLTTISDGILLSNSVIAFVIGLLLLLALQKTIIRLTQPLYSISSVMQKTELGKNVSRINENGPQEVQHITSAFNSMITALAERDEKLQKQNINLEKQAVRDHLTRLINRVGFEQSLKTAIEECSTLEVQHALCYMDLDKFKIVNDSCGHGAGDELLKNISEIFKHHIRKDNDILARVGGDEFALILKNCSLEKARSIGENICRDVKNYRFKWNSNVFSIGVSIGIIQLNKNTGDIQDVISKVDSACYTAKEKGRDQVFITDADDSKLIKPGSETQIAKQVIDHIENNKFKLLCQKIKPLKSEVKAKLHYEIFFQMTGSDGKPVPKHKVLSAAERYNLMNRVDQWVITQTLKQLNKNRAFIDNLATCTIDISASSLNNEQFISFIEGQLNIFEIPPDIICFSITETTTINNISNAIQFTNSIHKLGCRVALNDFVSNSSSFSYIKKMNFDYLKIHGDFFKGFANNQVNQVIVKSINDIAHILNIETIAEHIDDTESLNELINFNIGIDFAQGKAIAEPVSFDKCCNLGSCKLAVVS